MHARLLPYRTFAATVLVLVAFSSCGAPDTEELNGDDGAFLQAAVHSGVEEGSTAAGHILELVNAATSSQLTTLVTLSESAAMNIVQYRIGDDETVGTDDDERFDTLAELDAIPFVGQSAFNKLLDYVQSHGTSEAAARECMYSTLYKSMGSSAEVTIPCSVATLDSIGAITFADQGGEYGRGRSDGVCDAQDIPQTVRGTIMLQHGPSDVEPGIVELEISFNSEATSFEMSTVEPSCGEERAVSRAGFGWNLSNVLRLRVAPRVDPVTRKMVGLVVVDLVGGRPCDSGAESLPFCYPWNPDIKCMVGVTASAYLCLQVVNHHVGVDVHLYRHPAFA